MPTGSRKVQLGDKCTRCEVILNINNCKKIGSNFELQAMCRWCYLKARRSVPSKSKYNQRRQWLEHRFGISIHSYNNKLELQFGGCAICKKPCNVKENLSVDHNHKTGQIRDLLCNRCNTVLGMVNEDDLLLSDMIEYLKRHNMRVSA